VLDTNWGSRDSSMAKNVGNSTAGSSTIFSISSSIRFMASFSWRRHGVALPSFCPSDRDTAPLYSGPTTIPPCDKNRDTIWHEAQQFTPTWLNVRSCIISRGGGIVGHDRRGHSTNTVSLTSHYCTVSQKSVFTGDPKQLHSF